MSRVRTHPSTASFPSLWREGLPVTRIQPITTYLKLPVQAAVLNGLRQVLGGYVVIACEIGNGAAHFDDPVVRPGRQPHGPETRGC